MIIKQLKGKKLAALTAGLVVMSFAVFAACGGDDDDDEDPTAPAGGNTPTATQGSGSETDYSSLSGDIIVDGSSTVGPITEAMAEEFGKVSDVDVSVGISGTGGGFEKFCKGETDMNDASRKIKTEEADACSAAGIEFVEFNIGVDGLTVVVNPENDFVECLTWSQLRKIWDTGSTVQTWADVDPAFPADDITLFGPGADSGTFDYFTEEINGKVDQSRSDYTASEDDNQLVQGVSNESNALGYFGYAYFQASSDELKAVAIDKDQDNKGVAVPADQRKGCIEPTDATIDDGSYSLARPLYVYVATESLAEAHVAGFMDFFLNNGPTLVAETGYIALSESEYQAELAKLN